MATFRESISSGTRRLANSSRGTFVKNKRIRDLSSEEKKGWKEARNPALVKEGIYVGDRGKTRGLYCGY